MSAGRRPQSETIGAWRHLALGDVGSTNTECFEEARAGDMGRLWITAERQLEGRGRRGRPWVSQSGNLYASLLLIDPAPANELASLPLVAAVAVHRAIEMVLPADKGAQLAIKWPNDILLGGAKVCGILLESEMLSDGRRAVVIGQGINIAHAPEPQMYATTRLADAVASLAPDVLFSHLFSTMAEELEIWDAGRGLARTLDAWRERAGGMGEPITVNLADRRIEGIFNGIDGAGRLVLLKADKTTMTIAAGDVFLSLKAPPMAATEESS